MTRERCASVISKAVPEGVEMYLNLVEEAGRLVQNIVRYEMFRKKYKGDNDAIIRDYYVKMKKSLINMEYQLALYIGANNLMDVVDTAVNQKLDDNAMKILCGKK